MENVSFLPRPAGDRPVDGGNYREPLLFLFLPFLPTFFFSSFFFSFSPLLAVLTAPRHYRPFWRFQSALDGVREDRLTVGERILLFPLFPFFVFQLPLLCGFPPRVSRFLLDFLAVVGAIVLILDFFFPISLFFLSSMKVSKSIKYFFSFQLATSDNSIQRLSILRCFKNFDFQIRLCILKSSISKPPKV